jgi:hypothetical protein
MHKLCEFPHHCCCRIITFLEVSKSYGCISVTKLWHSLQDEILLNQLARRRLHLECYYLGQPVKWTKL